MKSTDMLRGTGQVYAFTLSQFIKGKANIITLVILLLFSLASVPLATIFGGSTDTGAEKIFEMLYVQNDTGLDMNFKGLGQTVIQEALAFPETPLSGEALLQIYADETGYHLDVICDSDDEDIAAVLLSKAQNILNTARYDSLNADPEQLQILNAGFQTERGTVAGYLDSTDLNYADTFAIQYVYAILVMILSLFSSAYIVRAVIEEKASKLVETLMVSVKPLALIIGKILAVMTYIFMMLVLMLIGVVASYLITGYFMEVASPVDLIRGMGLDLAGMNVGPLTVVIVTVSLVLGYLTFSILSGLVGSGCSSMEDVESANLSVIMIVMAGYLVACFTVGIGSKAVGLAVSLIPVVSIFCAPVQYVCGTISFGILCVAWLIQLAIVVLLAKFCARIYHDLLLYRGSKLKLRQMLAMARRKKGGAAV